MRWLVLLLCLTSVARADDAAVAVADFQRHQAAGRDVRYLSLAGVPEAVHADFEAVLRFLVPYCSQATLLDDQVPVRVPGTSLLRIDLGGLRWDASEFSRMAARSPYTSLASPLITRADWLIWELHDATASDAYYRLVYGSKPPKTRDEFLRFWGIVSDANLAFGSVEGASRVNKGKDGARWIEHYFGVGREAWGTRDVLRVGGRKDPLNHPAGDFQHDAEEWFVLVPKVTLGVRGVMAATILADANGQIVHEAPVKALEDYTLLAGDPRIRNPGSCISCHDGGSQEPSVNAVPDALKKGVLLYARTDEDRRRIEQFHLGGLRKELGRWREDYAAAIKAVNGLSAEANAALFRIVLDWYRGDLSLGQAALELGTTPEELALAVGYSSANKVDVGVRVARLAQGETILRSAWEAEFLKVKAYLEAWRSKDVPKEVAPAPVGDPARSDAGGRKAVSRGRRSK